MKKRLLTWLLALCVGAGIVVCPVDGKVDVWAEESSETELETEDLERAASFIDKKTYTDGNWEYRVIEGNKAWLKRYIGTDTEVTIPSKVKKEDGSGTIDVTEIGSIFSDNNAVIEVIISEGIEKIGSFRGCNNLVKIVIPDSVTEISNGAFAGCKSLESITIPKNVTKLEYEDEDTDSIGTFDGCIKLQKILVDVENPNYTSVNGILCNKSGDTMLAYPEGKKDFIIPASVNYLSVRMQHRIRTFTNIQIENGNTSFEIVNNIFYGNNKSELLYCLPGMENISSIVVPNGITRIADNAFFEFHNLTSVTLPDGLQEIGNYAFSKCENLKSVVLPEGLQAIGESVFSDCTNLERVTLPDSLLRIAPDTFENCVKLTGVTLPSGLLEIGSGAFEKCSSLTEIVFPESLTSIGQYAFWSCDNLKKIEIPKNVKTLHDKWGAAFTGKNIESFNVSEENPYYSSVDGVLYDKAKTSLLQCPRAKRSVNIPESVTYIAYGAFLGCSKLQKVDLPNGLDCISHWAFSGCSKLQGIILPDSVTSIGMHAFHGCVEMKFIAIPNSVSSIEQHYVFVHTINHEDQLLDVVIKCMKDSYAEEYAKEVGLKYEIVDSFDGLIVEVKEEENPSENTDNKVESINLDKSALTFDTIGSSQKLTATVTPATQLSQVTWSTSNEKVATVKDGAVTAKGNGTATITASLGDKTAAATVTVSQKCKKVTMTLNGQTVNGTLKAKVGKTYNFKTIVTPQNADKKNAKITWATSNKKIATVKNGKVSVKKSGTVTITAKTADGKTTKIKLKAGKQKVKVSKVKITGNKTMKVKGKQTLDLTVTPATADNTKVSWSSSNKKIIAVDSKGKVTAKKKGTATITAKAKDGSGKKASFKIRVK